MCQLVLLKKNTYGQNISISYELCYPSLLQALSAPSSGPVTLVRYGVPHCVGASQHMGAAKSQSSC